MKEETLNQTLEKPEPKTRQALAESSEWNFDLLRLFDQEIARVAAIYGLDTYPTRSK